MGFFDFFRRRRQRESATAGLELTQDPSQHVGSMTTPTEAATSQSQSGIEVQGETYDLAALGQIGALIAQAAREGNIQVHQGTPQEIDLRGTGLREELLGIMHAHGIDAESGSGQQIDASQAPDMQQQILDALSQHGVDVQGMSDAGSIQIDSTGGLDTSSGSGFGGDSGSSGDSGGSDSGGDSGSGGSSE